MYGKIMNAHGTIVRYFVIGVSASCIDVGAFAVLFNLFGYSSLQATTASVLIATIWAFSLNAFLNFKVSDFLPVRLALYLAVSGSGLVTSICLLYVFGGHFGINENIVKIASLPLIFVQQYLLNKHVTFRVLGRVVSEATTT